MEDGKCKYIHPYGKHVGVQCERRNMYGNYCISHKDYKNGQCSAILEQGVNKGKRCSRPCLEKSSVCGKHGAFEKKITEFKSAGKFKCFRMRCNEPVDASKSYCLECKEKKAAIKKCKAHIAQGERKGKQCTNKAIGDYCEKHADHSTLVEIAKMRNMNICGKGVRCSELIPNYLLYCDACVESRRKSEESRYKERIADVTRCCDCGKVPDEFATTIKGSISRYCKDCFIKMRLIEDKRNRKIENESIKNPELYFNRYKFDAGRRGLTFELSYSQFMAIVSQSCYYCEAIQELSYNGIDRVDNKIGYNVSNCVSACSMCNLMKSSHDEIAFVSHCKAISEFQKTGTTSYSRLVWKGINNTSFYEYKHIQITRRFLDFVIDEKLYYDLKNSSCYLCGQNPPTDSFNGIDRIDSDIGYIETNCAPCCVYCNRMKNDYSLEIFLGKCHSIAVKFDAQK